MKRLISILLHHANRTPNIFGKKEDFYKKKKQLLEKHGKLIGHDVQHIEGKQCFTCDGTGIFTKYFFRHGEYVYEKETCWNCHSGWFKLPQYNILQRVKFGDHIFHIPLKRHYSEKELNEIDLSINIVIEGYIQHSPGKRWITHLFWIIFLTWDYVQYFRFRLGRGYMPRWTRPYNTLNNMVGIISRKSVRRFFWEHLTKTMFGTWDIGYKMKSEPNEDELPF